MFATLRYFDDGSAFVFFFENFLPTCHYPYVDDGFAHLGTPEEVEIYVESPLSR